MGKRRYFPHHRIKCGADSNLPPQTGEGTLDSAPAAMTVVVGDGAPSSGAKVQHRIRAATLVVHDNRLLLIRSPDRNTGEQIWVPPGGAVQGDESIFECARREAFEEAGIHVELDRIVYVR